MNKYVLHDTWSEDRDRRQTDCSHSKWSKRCGICGFIMDSDVLDHDAPHKEISISDKEEYTEEKQ